MRGNLTRYLLSKIAEEASEVAKEALKAQQFGLYEQYKHDGPDNYQRLISEIKDLCIVVDMLVQSESTYEVDITIEEEDTKKTKVMYYYDYSEKVRGKYDDSPSST